MPEKALTVATYAAGASLAAITLIYVFAPTYFLDSDPSGSGANPLAAFSGRKKGAVGLTNAANDCFINSVLQALAGLGDLRRYLIRETHRRNIDDSWVYAHAVPDDAASQLRGAANGAAAGPAPLDPASPRRRPMPAWKVEGLQAGIVTKGLKDILDQLNERPIYKKTISAVPFVRVLEVAFRQRISRQQQDAQEFLQVVAERLCDEYHAGRRARRYARRKVGLILNGGLTAPVPAPAPAPAPAPVALDSGLVEAKLASLALATEGTAENEQSLPNPSASSKKVPDIRTTQVPDGDGEPAEKAAEEEEMEEEDEDEDGFPLEGRIESQIECLTCGFKPRPTEQTFCTLTLNVPQISSTTLNACFDGLFKTEYIDEFKCEKCRLLHAKQVFEAELARSTSESFRARGREAIAKLQAAIETDPERPPEDVPLPDSRHAPKRRIARHTRLISFPKILAIHLSRSIYDASQLSQKNSAKVSFPERLPLGGLLQQRKYKLLGLVTHKGSHYSGHYESFRRQNVYPPYSNPSTFRPSGVYTRTATPAATPQLTAAASVVSSHSGSPLAASTPDLLPPPSGANASTPSLGSTLQQRPSPSSSLSAGRGPAPTSAPTSAPSQRESPARDGSGSGSGSNTGTGSDTAATETSSLRSVARSTLSRIAPSSLSRPGSRSGSLKGAAKANGSSPSPAAPQQDDDKDKGRASTSASTLKPATPAPPKRRRHPPERWWRISDEKVKEASTREVLGMQREVYLLFYELERESSLLY